MVQAGLGADIGDKGLFIEAEGFFGNNNHKAPLTVTRPNLAGLGAVGYSFLPEKKVHPYILEAPGSCRISSIRSRRQRDRDQRLHRAAGISFRPAPS
jgi:hypothetical protein